MKSSLQNLFFSRFVTVILVGFLCTLTAAFFVARKQVLIQQGMLEQKLFNGIAEKKDKIILFNMLEDSNQLDAQLNVLAEEFREFKICLESKLISDPCPFENSFVPAPNSDLRIRYELKQTVKLQLMLEGILSWPNIVIFVFLSVLAVLTHRFINKNILGPIDKVTQFFEEFSHYRYGDKLFRFNSQINEWAHLEENINRVLARIRVLEAELVSNTKFETARQVAHDIRSPLTALNLVSAGLDNIPDEKRILLRSAVQRINDIANSLLGQQNSANARLEVNSNSNTFLFVDSFQCEMLAPLLEGLVSEKRVQLGNNPDIELTTRFVNTYGLFSKIDPSSFKRAISNLLNNAIESSHSNSPLKVQVELSTHADRAQITISDNGCGMPEAVVVRLGEREFTYGKSMIGGGNGLGVHFAKRTLEACGGAIRFESEVGVGTTVTVELPLVSAPKWFAKGICLNAGATVVSLDDDETIHQTWSQRLRASNELPVCHVSFFSASDLENWVSEESLAKVQYFFVDFELSGQATTGLDVIERLSQKYSNFVEKAVLVTSRHEESKIKARCEKLNVKILPKTMVNQIPIEVA